MPDRFPRREFGFLYHGRKFFQRHMGFSSSTAIHDFMADKGPAHSYYSTAFYKQPNAPTMQEKGWMGAELIFDLDADHVPGAEKKPYREQLDLVKDYFWKLVTKFILQEFGFRESDLLLTFSGGRGYHCHVLEERAMQLSSAERREIVDYVTGTGLELTKFVRPKKIVTQSGAFTREVDSMHIEPLGSAGWGNRINEAVRLQVREWKSKSPEELRQELSPVYKFTAQTWESFQRDLARASTDRIAEGFLDFGQVFVKIAERKLNFESILPKSKGETDEPVTSDIKRLIRLPGSLHGKSGLKVVPLKVDQIQSFDPLVEAVAFTDEPTPVNVVKPSKVDVGGVQLDLPVGKATVPEAAAVMLIARGAGVPV